MAACVRWLAMLRCTARADWRFEMHCWCRVRGPERRLRERHLPRTARQLPGHCHPQHRGPLHLLQTRPDLPGRRQQHRLRWPVPQGLLLCRAAPVEVSFDFLDGPLDDHPMQTTTEMIRRYSQTIATSQRSQRSFSREVVSHKIERAQHSNLDTLCPTSCLAQVLACSSPMTTHFACMSVC